MSRAFMGQGLDIPWWRCGLICQLACFLVLALSTSVSAGVTQRASLQVPVELTSESVGQGLHSVVSSGSRPMMSATFFGTSAYYRLMFPALSPVVEERDLKFLDAPEPWKLILYSDAVRTWDALYQGRRLVHRHQTVLVDWEFFFRVPDVRSLTSAEADATSVPYNPSQVSWLELERGILPTNSNVIDTAKAKFRSGPKGENDRLPEVEVSYPFRFENTSVDTLLRLNLSRFDSVGFDDAEAFRYDTEFRVSRQFENGGWYSRPSVTMNYTQYDFISSGIRDLERSLPVWELDNGWVFEQLIAGEPEALVHTVEPRIYYLYIPHVSQSGLPLEDVRKRPFGLGGIFSRNRFQGRGRIGDTNQASFGLTSRLFSHKEDVEYLRADIAQTLYFSERQIGLRDVIDESSRTFSDIASSLAAKYEGLALSSSVRWDTLNQEVSTASTRLSHTITSKAAVSMAHVQYAGTEEAELQIHWLLNPAWVVESSVRHSIGDARIDTILAGLHYRGCGFSLVLDSRRAWDTASSEHQYALDVRFSLDARPVLSGPQCQ